MNPKPDDADTLHASRSRGRERHGAGLLDPPKNPSIQKAMSKNENVVRRSTCAMARNWTATTRCARFAMPS